jgi:hypothetical protein
LRIVGREINCEPDDLREISVSRRSRFREHTPDLPANAEKRCRKSEQNRRRERNAGGNRARIKQNQLVGVFSRHGNFYKVASY